VSATTALASAKPGPDDTVTDHWPLTTDHCFTFFYASGPADPYSPSRQSSVEHLDERKIAKLASSTRTRSPTSPTSRAARA
jgi:hypothetical protein